MRRLRPPALATLLLVAAPLLAQDGREVLLRSLERESAATYAGVQTTVVTDAGKVRRTEQVVKRRGLEKLRIEYLAPPRLRGELIVDDGTRFRHYHPALNLMEEGPSRLQRARQRHQERLKGLRAGNQEVALGGEEILLGRRVTMVAVTPRKPDRPIRTLWLDRETGVPLRIEEKGRGGWTSVTTFTRFTPDPILGDAEFRLPVPTGARVVPSSLGRPISVQRAERIARQLWGGLPLPASLPAGYSLTSTHELSFRGRPVIALRYTRGRDDLSLFVSGGGGEPFAAPVQAHLNVVQRPLGPVLVTVVGSLPPAELQQLLDSVHLSADGK